jgi:NADH-quinone oxidoreductase subunit L
MIIVEPAGSSNLFAYAPFLILFPIAGLLINLLFGRRLGERFTGWVASGAIGLAFATAVVQFLALRSYPQGANVLIAEWITIGPLDVPWELRVDSLSVAMSLMVTGVSMLIHIYAVGYMHDDVRFQGDPGRYTRFFVFFNLFVGAMMVLVTASNMVMMFVGWEGVGLCSYLLIGFWYEGGENGIGNAIAGKKAFIVNRIGDVGFLLAMFLTYHTFQTLRFDGIFEQARAMGPAGTGVLTGITLLLMLAVTGKSAQIPLFVWLPDAMAGPTPVSALIHAATMVTSGVYMITRTHVLFELAPVTRDVVALVGAATALLAATIAVTQYDIKRVLAYSTISQLGYMVAAVGVEAYAAGMFHLITHAFFKALLFLSAGSVILGIEHGHHQHAGEQSGHSDAGEEKFDPNDMRIMGGLRKRMPVTFWVYLIGALALSGVPPLSGFFSKDEILTDTRDVSQLVYILLAVAAFLTALYMGRQILMVFFGEARSEAARQAKENPRIITLPLIALAALAALGGALNFPGVHTLTNYLSLTLEHLHVTEFTPLVARLSSGLALLAIWFAWLLYDRRGVGRGDTDPLEPILEPVYTAMAKKWWVDDLYARLFVRPYKRLASWMVVGEGEENEGAEFWEEWVHEIAIGRSFRAASDFLALTVDLGFVDALFNGMAGVTYRIAHRLRKVQTGIVRTYVMAAFFGAILIIGYLLVYRG